MTELSKGYLFTYIYLMSFWNPCISLDDLALVSKGCILQGGGSGCCSYQTNPKSLDGIQKVVEESQGQGRLPYEGINIPYYDSCCILPTYINCLCQLLTATDGLASASSGYIGQEWVFKDLRNVFLLLLKLDWCSKQYIVDPQGKLRIFANISTPFSHL